MDNTPHTLTARTTEDLLAAVPCVLGFHPERSLVLLTFSDRGRSFHARVDLPDDPGEHADLCASLVTAALNNEVERVILVAYTDDVLLAADVLEAVHDAFDAHDIDVLDLVRADGRHWFPMRPGLPDRMYDGVSYDTSSHPFSAQSVLAGRVTHSSREELAATLRQDPGVVVEVQKHLASRAGEFAAAQRPAEARWVLARVSEHVATGRSLAIEDVARLVAACRDSELHDVALALISRDAASRHVDFWRDVVRRCPVAWTAPPAGLLALAAWQAGQGALAWLAIDRCREGDPDHWVAELVARALDAAMPPETWPGVGTSFLPVLGRDA